MMYKLRRIGPKMLLSLLATFIAVFGVFVVLVITRTTDLADGMARDLVLNTGENYANELAIEFNKTDELILGLKFAAEQFETIPVENRRDYLDGLLEKSIESDMTVVIGIWACFEPDQLDGLDGENRNSDFSDATGRYITYFTNADSSANGIGKTYLTGYDVPGEGDYYLVAYETGEPYVTQPYDYEIDGKIVSIISLAYPIMDSSGKTVGVIGGDYSLEYINTLNAQVKLFETGFGKLVTDQDYIVAHVEEELIETLDQDLSETTEIKATLQTGGTYVNKLYSPVLAINSYKAFTQVPMGNSGINWVYGVVVSEAEVMSQTNQLVELISVIGIIGLVIATLIIVLLSRSISKPIKAMSKITASIAGGDLSVNVPEKYRKHKDEIGDLSKNLQVMRDSLVETVVGINNATISLQKQVSDMNTALSSMNDRIVDTSAAAEELSAGMEETGASAEEMNATAMDIERAVETISEKAEGGADKSGEISTRAAQLDNSINNSINKSNDIFDRIKESLEQALEDSKAVDEINALADAILGITSQTNLLALNASIEAARAGEAGKGFAVVADEIGLLANNSKNTVNQIQEITKVVMSAVNALSKSSADLLDFVAKDVHNDYENMLESAKSYTDDAAYISSMTSDFSTTAVELLTSVKTLAVAINEVSRAAQEGAETTNVVAGQTTDISSNASTMVDNMEQTQRTSDELAALVSKFKYNN